MANFVQLETQILGRNILVCISPGSRKTSNLTCDILGFKAQCYISPKKDSFWSGLNNISIEAITICTYLNFDLSSIENVNIVVSKRDEIIKEWNNLLSKCNSNWEKMLEKINFEKTNCDAIQKGFDQYKWIMNNLDNQNEEFRKKFAAFYKINLGLKHCEDKVFFFNLLSLCISIKNDDYADILKLLSENTRRNEMSFTSKIVATVNPQMPIIDKIICGHLKISRPSYGELDRRKTKSVDVFIEIKNTYKAFLNTPKGEMLLKTFNEKIIQDNFNTTDIKKLDFILWQNR